MGRPRKQGARILYVEIVLDNGVRWRIDPHARMVQEVEERGPHLEVRGPVHLRSFIAALETERAARLRSAGGEEDDG